MRKPANTTNRHSPFGQLLCLLLVLITVHYALQIEIPRMVFVAIIVLIALLGDRNEILAICMCCIPLHESVDFFYSLVFCLTIFVVKNYRHIRINISVILVLAMVLWELLHCLGHSFSLIGFISNIVPLMVLAILLCTDADKLDHAFIVRAFSFATLGICITLFVRVLYQSGFNILLAVAGLQRLGIDDPSVSQNMSVAGGAVNPNTLGIICVLAATGLLQLRTAKRGNPMDMLVVCAIMVFGALTASRTYLVCLALMALLLLFSQKGTLVQKLRFLCILILMLILALIVLYLCFPDLMSYYIGRFQVKDLTTGRMDLMAVYHEYIVSNPRVILFGVGLQDFGVKLTQTYMVAENVPHNAIQELVIAWGLPGLILFAALLLVMPVQSKRFCSRQGLINYIPLLIILVKSQAGQLLNSPYTMLTLSYAYLSLCADLTPRPNNRILTRTDAQRRRSGYNINQLRRKTHK